MYLKTFASFDFETFFIDKLTVAELSALYGYGNENSYACCTKIILTSLFLVEGLA